MSRSRTSTAGSGLLIGAVLSAVVTVSATGCARDDGSSGGLPALGADDHVDGEPVPFQGVLRIGPQGCIMIDLTDPAGDAADRWVVWPTGAELIVGTEDSGEGALVDGERYAKGHRIAGTGRVVDLAALPGGGERGGGYYAEVGRYCDALQGGVLVVDDVRRA